MDAARERALELRGSARSEPVLELGSVPLPVVTARIDRFIAEGGKGLPGYGLSAPRIILRLREANDKVGL